MSLRKGSFAACPVDSDIPLVACPSSTIRRTSPENDVTSPPLPHAIVSFFPLAIRPSASRNCRPPLLPLCSVCRDRQVSCAPGLASDSAPPPHPDRSIMASARDLHRPPRRPALPSHSSHPSPPARRHARHPARPPSTDALPLWKRTRQRKRTEINLD